MLIAFLAAASAVDSPHFMLHVADAALAAAVTQVVEHSNRLAGFEYLRLGPPCANATCCGMLQVLLGTLGPGQYEIVPHATCEYEISGGDTLALRAGLWRFLRSLPVSRRRHSMSAPVPARLT